MNKKLENHVKLFKLVAYKFWSVNAFVIIQLQKIKIKTDNTKDLRITKTERNRKNLASNLNSAPNLAISIK